MTGYLSMEDCKFEAIPVSENFALAVKLVVIAHETDNEDVRKAALETLSWFSNPVIIAKST